MRFRGRHPAHNGAQREIERLQVELAEVTEALEAIRSGAVDAIITTGPSGQQIYTRVGADVVYRTLLEHLDEGVATIGPDDAVMFANRRLTDLLGTSQEALFSSEIEDWAVQEDKAALAGLLKVGRSEEAQAEIRLAAVGPRSVRALVRVAPLPIEPEGSMVGLVVADLGEPAGLGSPLGCATPHPEASRAQA